MELYLHFKQYRCLRNDGPNIVLHQQGWPFAIKSLCFNFPPPIGKKSISLILPYKFARNISTLNIHVLPNYEALPLPIATDDFAILES